MRKQWVALLSMLGLAGASIPGQAQVLKGSKSPAQTKAKVDTSAGQAATNNAGAQSNSNLKLKQQTLRQQNQPGKTTGPLTPPPPGQAANKTQLTKGNTAVTKGNTAITKGNGNTAVTKGSPNNTAITKGSPNNTAITKGGGNTAITKGNGNAAITKSNNTQITKGNTAVTKGSSANQTALTKAKGPQ